MGPKKKKKKPHESRERLCWEEGGSLNMKGVKRVSQRMRMIKIHYRCMKLSKNKLKSCYSTGTLHFWMLHKALHEFIHHRSPLGGILTSMPNNPWILESPPQYQRSTRGTGPVSGVVSTGTYRFNTSWVVQRERGAGRRKDTKLSIQAGMGGVWRTGD